MFGTDFYPTPPKVVEKMLAPYCVETGGTWSRKTYPALSQMSIIDPSAGSGNLLAYVASHAKRSPETLQAVEIDADLRAILQRKKFAVVGEDFLKFETFHRYDLILMNPPFSKGAAHFLKAWTIADGTDIVCLLNSETLNNPCTKARRVIVDLLEKYGGTVEDLGDCFKDAERKTGVDVSLVRVTKPRKQSRFFFEGGNFETKAQEMPEFEESNLPQVHDVLKAYENAFAASIEAFKTLQRAQKLFSSATAIFEKGRDYNERKKWGEMGFDEFLKSLNGAAWGMVLKESKFENHLTTQTKKDFLEKFQEQKDFAFTKANMLALIEILFLNKDKILMDCLEEVFDYFTKYHKENRVHVEGWKTNDAWMVAPKVILPNMVGIGWEGKIRMHYYGQRDKLNDIDRALCYLTGKKLGTLGKYTDPETGEEKTDPKNSSIVNALETSFENRKVNKCESHFFTMRYFKKGTLHLEFKDKKLLDLFNQTVAKNRGWLAGTGGKSWQRGKAA